MLLEAHLKESINAELASLIAIRDYMVKMRTSALNKRGIKVEKQALGSGKGFARRWACMNGVGWSGKSISVRSKPLDTTIPITVSLMLPSESIDMSAQ